MALWKIWSRSLTTGDNLSRMHQSSLSEAIQEIPLCCNEIIYDCFTLTQKS